MSAPEPTVLKLPKAQALRKRSYAMFDDMAGVPGVARIVTIAGQLEVHFDGVLDEPTQTAVMDRLTSRSDEEAATRAALAEAATAAHDYTSPARTSRRTSTAKTTASAAESAPATATDEETAAVIQALTDQVTWLTDALAHALDYVLEKNA